MRVATWNVNSVKQRMPRLVPWLDERRPNVVCLQETKLTDEAFADLFTETLAERGYEYAHVGEGRWNGVAILSNAGLDDVVPGVAGAPGFPGPEARAIAATCGGVRVQCVYVPNGRVPDSEHYQYKLAWLAALREVVAAAGHDAIVCGDMNIAPTDADVFDPEAYVGQTHVTGPEREALAALQAVGLRDLVRDRWPDRRVFTYWDYRAGMFHQDPGLGGPAGPEWYRAERPRPGDRGPGRGARRRHRPGRTAALGARVASAGPLVASPSGVAPRGFPQFRRAFVLSAADNWPPRASPYFSQPPGRDRPLTGGGPDESREEDAPRRGPRHGRRGVDGHRRLGEGPARRAGSDLRR